jgi:hypothetical protein
MRSKRKCEKNSKLRHQKCFFKKSLYFFLVKSFAKKLDVHHLPDMLFGKNHLQVIFKKSEFQIFFDAFQALRQVDNTKVTKLAFAEAWKER